VTDTYAEIAARFREWLDTHPGTMRGERVAKFDEIADVILDARDALEAVVANAR